MKEIEKRMVLKFNSLSPILFSKMIPEEKLEGELPEEYEKRTWKSRAHYNEYGKVIIPGHLIKASIEPAAKLLGRRVGGGKTGRALRSYLRLIRIEGDIDTGISRKELTGVTSYVSANGKPEGGKVPRTFPKISRWEGQFILVYPTIGNILNEIIILEHLEVAGSCVGIGHWRPGSPSCGNYGRFLAEKVE